MAKTIALAILHEGLVRRFNEDNLYIIDGYAKAHQSLDYEKPAASSRPVQLFAVADGAGGGGIGDAASSTAMKVLDKHRRALRMDLLDFETFAREAVNSVNRALCEQLSPFEGLRAGTTFSLLAIGQGEACTLSLGGSRICLFRDHRLIRLTEDHQSLLPNHHQISRHLGFLAESAATESENITRTILQRGDIFLLMTDGVTKALNDQQIEAELSAPTAFVQTIRRLRERCLQAGGGDNLALVAVKILDPAASEPLRSRKASRRLAASLGGLLGHPRTPDLSEPADIRPRPAKPGRTYYGPAVRGHAGIGVNSPPPRWLRPLMIFLFFILLGIVLGRAIFLLHDLHRWLLSFG